MVHPLLRVSDALRGEGVRLNSDDGEMCRVYLFSMDNPVTFIDLHFIQANAYVDSFASDPQILTDLCLHEVYPLALCYDPSTRKANPWRRDHLRLATCNYGSLSLLPLQDLYIWLAVLCYIPIPRATLLAIGFGLVY